MATIIDDQAGEAFRKSVVQVSDNDTTTYAIRSISVTNPQTSIIDEVGNDIYIGKAEIGASTAAAVWQVTLFEKNGSVSQLKWADGDSNFDNVWDNRLSLTYI
jgi:hypothetical protein